MHSHTYLRSNNYCRSSCFVPFAFMQLVITGITMFIIILLTQILLENKLWATITDVERELPSGYLINPAMRQEQKKTENKNVRILPQQREQKILVFFIGVLFQSPESRMLKSQIQCLSQFVGFFPTNKQKFLIHSDIILQEGLN